VFAGFVSDIGEERLEVDIQVYVSFVEVQGVFKDIEVFLFLWLNGGSNKINYYISWRLL
jgi:hypothetical protein